MTTEVEWRKHPYFTQYEISNTGLIRHDDTKLPKSVYTSNTGYIYTLNWDKNAKRNRNCKLHRLVGQTFIENVDNKPEIDHIDGNKTNNHVSNLRWATRSENAGNKPIPEGRIRGCYPKGGKFRAGISVNNKMIWLGMFETETEAGQMYNKYIVENGLQEWRRLNAF